MITYESDLHQARIKVFGIGGGGGNTVNCLARKKVSGVNLCLLNTDKQALSISHVPNKIGLGQSLTKGLGAGANPQIGREAALESEGVIKNMMQGSDLLFLAVGMGGGTGTGASPEVARIAREEGILTVAVVTLPFSFEGKRRMATALEGLERLKEFVDTSIIIENQKIMPLICKSSTMGESFEIVDNVLCRAVMAITDLITKPGLINLDFADLRSVLREGGSAFMVTGAASGRERAKKAAALAIQSPLMMRNSLEGARRIIINISGNSEMTLEEVDEAASLVHKKADEECHIIVGAVIDEYLGDEIRVTVIATEFNDELEEAHHPIGISHGGGLKASLYTETVFSQKLPSTVKTLYESSTGKKFVAQESNLDCPAYLRKKREMMDKSPY